MRKGIFISVILASGSLLLPGLIMADQPLNMGGRTIAANGCVDPDISLLAARDKCLDWLDLFYDQEDWVITGTHCPPQDKVPPPKSKGKKSIWTPNGFCGQVICPEDMLEYNCTLKRKPHAE